MLYFAYQINLYIGNIFKKLSNLSNIAEEVIGIINFFSHSKVWLRRLQIEQINAYKSQISLISSATMR